MWTVIRVFPLLAGLWSMRSLHAQVQELGIRIVHALPDPRPALVAGLGDEDRELWQATVLAACAAPGADPKARHVVRGRTMIRRLHRPARTLLDPAEYFSALFLQRAVQGDWEPVDPDPDGGPEAVAAMMIGTAELARLRGVPDAGLYRRAGELLVRRIPNGSRDPGGEMLVAIALLGVVACGEPESGRELVAALTAGDEAMFGVTGYWDLPQAATMALAVGAYLVATDPGSAEAAIFVALARRLGARQDYPVMHETVRRLADPPEGAPAGQWRARVEEVAGLPRSRAVRLLRESTAALRRRA